MKRVCEKLIFTILNLNKFLKIVKINTVFYVYKTIWFNHHSHSLLFYIKEADFVHQVGYKPVVVIYSRPLSPR